MAEEPSQKSPATLGDVLYAKSKAPVPEQVWARLVEAIAAGDQLALCPHAFGLLTLIDPSRCGSA